MILILREKYEHKNTNGGQNMFKQIKGERQDIQATGYRLSFV